MSIPIISHQIQTTDGESYHLLLSHAPASSSQPVILCLPAMGVPARKYLQLAESLNEKNIISAIFELRGIGSSSVRASRKANFGYNEILTLDLPKAFDFIRQHYPNNPIYLLGHSLGGQLSLLYTSLHVHQVSGLIGVATGTPYFKGWKFPYNLALLVSSKLMKLIANIIGHYPGRKLGFAGREARQLIKDWASSVVSGRYQLESNQHQFESAIKQIKLSALMITIDKDFLAPPASIKNLGEKLVSSQITYHHLINNDFKNHSLGHFNWMKEPEPVVQKIIEWIKNK